jgi:penicillin-binding protein 2
MVVVGVLGMCILLLRLWGLQIVHGAHERAIADAQRVRLVLTPAPRGEIVDRNGAVIVSDRVAPKVEVDPSRLPPPGPPRHALYARLGRVLGLPASAIQRAVVHGRRAAPYADVTLRIGLPLSQLAYLLERQQRFPGVQVVRVHVRGYPLGRLAAQVVGTVGEISEPELHEPRFRGARPGDIVGQSGLEYTYNRWLRGRDGAARVVADALGHRRGVLANLPARPGRTLRTSLDLGLEREGYTALRAGFALAHRHHNPAGAGAFAALDPRDGAVLALGSWPSFDPDPFAHGGGGPALRRLARESSSGGLVDRAIQGTYPTGSTFKPITAVAALQSGVITPKTIVNDPGTFSFGGFVRHNAGNTPHGDIAMAQALQVSSDVFFYRLGAQLAFRPRQPLQTWAQRLGIGRPTGIDLPGEFGGLLPSPAWRDRLFQARHTDRPWSAGDDVNLAVGQGDLQATPLQMAVAYSAIANGGLVVRPRLGLDVERGGGRATHRVRRPPGRRIALSPLARSTILQGLRLAASAPGGTSADVFRGFPMPVYGKTGTAQRPGQADQSWYLCYVPDARRPIVLAVTIERGGFGAEAAAPAARLMLSKWFGIKGKVVEGQSRTL